MFYELFNTVHRVKHHLNTQTSRLVRLKRKKTLNFCGYKTFIRKGIYFSLSKETSLYYELKF